MSLALPAFSETAPVSRAVKTNTHSIGQYVELFDIADQSEKDAFELQVRRYLGEMAAPITCWRSPGNTEEASLAQLEKRLYEQFGLTSQALRILAARQQTGSLGRAKAVEAASALLSVHLKALNDELTLDSPHIVHLQTVDRFMGMFLKISSDPAARELKTLDYAGWIRLLGNGHPAMRIAKAKMEPTAAPPTPDIRLTRSQSDLVQKIEAFWKLKLSGCRVAGYDPRPIPLVVGPSGSGKSALVRHFAASEGLPMRDFNVGTWIVSGAKSEPPTLDRIAEFVEENDQGILFIDEVDKLFGNTDWTRYVQQEVFALLDGRTDSFAKWSTSIRAKFASSFFIVGAGTWQDLFNHNDREAGFHASESAAHPIDLSAQDVIPDELLMRFNADVLFLQPLSVEEFAERIDHISREAGREPLPAPRLEKLAKRAHASRRHNRWLEAYASRLLRRAVAVSEIETVFEAR